MSAFLVHPNHIRLLIQASIDHWHPTRQDPHQLMQLLFSENLASVHHRYPDCVDCPENTPGPIDDYAGALLWHRVANRISIVLALKAVLCYQHQTCEHPGHATSEAWRWVESLKDHLIGNLPGFEQAPAWDFTGDR